MTEKPLIFTGESVRGILADRKTQTRRICKVQADGDATLVDGPPGSCVVSVAGAVGAPYWCPHGVPGDRPWVKETWRTDAPLSECTGPADVRYAASVDEAEWAINKWRSPLFMPRWASRIALEMTGIRVERLQDITDADAKAEGVRPFSERAEDAPYRASYAVLWDEINYKRALWRSNPWVWRIEFCKRET